MAYIKAEAVDQLELQPVMEFMYFWHRTYGQLLH